MTPIPPTDLNRYRVRFLAQLLSEATADYWERRAETFEAARPRAGDYTGRATADQLDEVDKRCAQAAEACRFHAWLIRTEGAPGAARDALAALSEVRAAAADMPPKEPSDQAERPAPDAARAALLALSDVELAAALAARQSVTGRAAQ